MLNSLTFPEDHGLTDVFASSTALTHYLYRHQSIMSSSKKLTCRGTLRQVFICLRPPPHLGFCLGWCSSFVGSKSGQIQSVKRLQNMVSNKTQHPHPSQPHTVCIYCTLTRGRGEGGRRVKQERRLKGQ